MEFIVSFLVKILYNILYIFTLLHQEFKKYTQKVYLSNQNIKYIVDDINEISISIYYYFANHKREKNGDWCAVFHNEKNNLTQCYMDIHEIDTIANCQDKDDIFILKIDGVYVFRILNENYKTPENLQNNAKKTKKHFCSVDYTHPDMKETITINITEGMYRDNNEILSSTFVLWYLEHQELAYVFDDNYILKIMDGDINYIELKNTQYIKISLTEYEVLKNNFE